MEIGKVGGILLEYGVATQGTDKIIVAYEHVYLKSVWIMTLLSKCLTLYVISPKNESSFAIMFCDMFF